MSGADFIDFSAIVCDDTGVSAQEVAARALVARDDLGGGVTVPSGARPAARRAAMIEDVRVLTGVLAAELDTATDDSALLAGAARWASAAHRAVLRSDTFAFHAALAMKALDERTDLD